MGKERFEGAFGRYGQMPANSWILADESHWSDSRLPEPVIHRLDGPVDLQGYTTLVPSAQYYYYEDDKEAVFYLDDTKGEELLRCGIVERLDSGAEGDDVLTFRNDRYMAVFNSIMDFRGSTADVAFRTGTAILFKKTE